MLHKRSLMRTWFIVRVFTTERNFVDFMLRADAVAFFFPLQEAQAFKMWEKYSAHRCQEIECDETKQLHKTWCEAWFDAVKPEIGQKTTW